MSQCLQREGVSCSGCSKPRCLVPTLMFKISWSIQKKKMEYKRCWLEIRIILDVLIRSGEGNLPEGITSKLGNYYISR